MNLTDTELDHMNRMFRVWENKAVDVLSILILHLANPML